MIARNILFNALGGMWTLGIAIAAVPLQIRLLGMEAYGVIGFLASLQIILTLLDLGLPTMIIRKVAAEQRAAEATVSAAVGLYVLLGLAGGMLLASLGPVLCDLFLKPVAGQRDHIITAVILSGLAFALRWPVAVYAGVLAGMQRMDFTNGLRAAGTTLRSIGVCVPLYFLPDIRVYAGWLVVISLIELVAHVAACRRIWPGFPLWPHFGWAPLAGTWAFSAGMLLLAGESILLTQTDRLAIAHFCPLLELGHYSAACTFAFSLALFQGFVTSALLPAFASATNPERSTDRREAATEILMLSMSVPAIGLAVMGEGLLQYLLPPTDALAVAAPLSGLALGSLINSSISLAITDAIAKGQVWGIALLNLISLPFYLVILVIGVDGYGAVGAAAAWLILNLAYLISVPFTLDRGEHNPHAARLILRCSLPYWLSAFLFLGLAHVLLPDSRGWSLFGFLCGGAAHLVLGWFLLTPRTREMVTGIARQTLPSRSNA